MYWGGPPTANPTSTFPTDVIALLKQEIGAAKEKELGASKEGKEQDADRGDMVMAAKELDQNARLLEEALGDMEYDEDQSSIEEPTTLKVVLENGVEVLPASVEAQVKVSLHISTD